MKAGKTIPVLVLLIGALLVIAPFAYNMFDRAPAGAEMMKAFEPVMTDQNVKNFEGYETSLEEMMGSMPSDQQEQMKPMAGDFDMMIGVMKNNVENYQKANKLPMSTMPWFFVIPGVVLVVLAGIQLRAK